MQRTFDFYSDPGHGWLRVPRALIKTLGIEHEISNYSYKRREHAYLEEDSDARLFLTKYLQLTGKSARLNHHWTNKQSKIRSYQDYCPESTFIKDHFIVCTIGAQ